MAKFHYKDNWFFERLDDGSVKITNPTLLRGMLSVNLTVDPDSWASILASVSAQGETAESFQEARNFHHKGKTIT